MGRSGLVGYEINFNRYFYEYRPPRPLEEIEADIQAVEQEIVAMLRTWRAAENTGTSRPCAGVFVKGVRDDT